MGRSSIPKDSPGPAPNTPSTLETEESKQQERQGRGWSSLSPGGSSGKSSPTSQSQAQPLEEVVGQAGGRKSTHSCVPVPVMVQIEWVLRHGFAKHRLLLGHLCKMSRRKPGVSVLVL